MLSWMGCYTGLVRSKSIVESASDIDGRSGVPNDVNDVCFRRPCSKNCILLHFVIITRILFVLINAATRKSFASRLVGGQESTSKNILPTGSKNSLQDPRIHE